VLPLAHARVWVVASLLLLVAVIYLSLAPNQEVPTPGNFDKLQHAFAYAFLAAWFTGLVAKRGYWKVALALAALGLAMELLQHFMALGRQGDPLDMAANMLGIGIGVALGAWLTGGWALKVETWLKRN
jgi:VanZ family protein